MYSFFDTQFWIYAFLFIPVAFITFFLPGFFILKKYLTHSVLITFLLSIVLGVVLWGVQGYVLGYLHLRFLSYVYILFILWWGYQERYTVHLLLRNLWQELKALDKVVIALLLIGLLLQLMPMVLSGMRFSDGVRFYFVNEADGIMHLSYIQSLIRSFPPQEPGAVGLPLVNYHYWTDLVIADLSRVFTLPVSHLFFQYFPVLISLVTGLVVYAVIRVWGGSVSVARWALFLLYFSGDAAYLIYFLLHNTLAFHTPAIDNGVTQFFNMPHAFAKMIFLAGLIPLHFWITKKRDAWGVLAVIFFAPLVGFKVYYGIFAAFGFSALVAGRYLTSVVSLFRRKRSVQNIWLAVKQCKNEIVMLLLFAGISSLIYFPPNSGSGGFIFSPLEWPKLFLGEQALNFREWWLRVQVYEQAGNTRNIFIFNTLALIIALISIHGTRLLGIIPNKKLYKSLRTEGLLFFIPGIILFTFLGFFTLQETGLFNVFNFFVVTLVILSLFAAFTLSDLSQKRKVWAKVGIVLFVLITVPRVLFETGTMLSTYMKGNYRLISNEELEALAFLRRESPKNSVIQSHPKNSLDSLTPYVSFFSNRPTYFTGGGLTHNQPIEEREKNVVSLFSQPNANELAQYMHDLGIEYIYLQKDKEQEVKLIDESSHLQQVFENEGVILYHYVQ